MCHISITIREVCYRMLRTGSTTIQILAGQEVITVPISLENDCMVFLSMPASCEYTSKRPSSLPTIISSAPSFVISNSFMPVHDMGDG
jgi:hypothetical protein